MLADQECGPPDISVAWKRGAAGVWRSVLSCWRALPVPMLLRFLLNEDPILPNNPYTSNRPEQITCGKSTFKQNPCSDRDITCDAYSW